MTLLIQSLVPNVVRGIFIDYDVKFSIDIPLKQATYYRVVKNDFFPKNCQPLECVPFKCDLPFQPTVKEG